MRSIESFILKLENVAIQLQAGQHCASRSGLILVNFILRRRTIWYLAASDRNSDIAI